MSFHTSYKTNLQGAWLCLLFMSCRWVSYDAMSVYVRPGAVIFGLDKGVGGTLSPLFSWFSQLESVYRCEADGNTGACALLGELINQASLHLSDLVPLC
jgi:hypothetical protein